MTTTGISVFIDSSGATKGAAEIDRAAKTAVESVDRMENKFDELNKTLRSNGSWQKEAANEIVRSNAILANMATALEKARRSQDGLAKAQKESTTVVQQVNAAWDSMTTRMNQTLELIQKFRSAASEGYGFAKAAADVNELRDSFDAFMKNAGVNGDNLIGSVRDKMKSLVSDVEIMKMSMTTVNKGITEDPETIKQLFMISDALADISADGRTAEQIFGTLSDTIARGSSRGLAQFGLLPKYLDSSADKADVFLKKQELLNIVLEEGMKKVEILGEAGGSAADQFQKLEKEFANAADSIGQALLPAAIDFVNYARSDLIPAMQGLSEIIRDMYENTDAEARALRNMAGIGSAKILGEAQKELDELRKREGALIGTINGMTGGRSPMVDYRARTELDAVQKRIIELQDLKQKTLQTGKLMNQSEIFTGDLKKAERDVSEFFSGVTRSFDVFSGKTIQKSAKTSEKIKSDIKEGWSVTELDAVASLAAGAAANVIRFGEEFAEQMEKAREAAEEMAAEIDSEFSDLAGGIDEDLSDFDVGLGEDMTQLQKEQAEKMKADLENFTAQLRVNVGDAFQGGLYDAMNGGDFLKSFGESMRRQLSSALSAGITASIFGIGQGAGSFNVGSLFGMGGGGGMNMGFNPFSSGGGSGVGSGMGSGAGGSSGGGLGNSVLGGLFGKMGPLMKGGILQTGKLTQLLGTAGIAMYGMNKLFGEGGVFGSRVIHGQEQVSLSGDINSQVGQAMKQRDELLGSLIGASASTVQQLRDMQFYTTSVVGHKSGNGWTSKKTTTYEAVGVAEAQGSLSMFAELSQKATAEAAAREFEIAMRQVTNPLAALNMTIDDLSMAVQNASESNLLAAQQQLRQAQQSKTEYLKAFQESWFQTRMGTAAVSAGNIKTPSMTGSSGTLGSYMGGGNGYIRDAMIPSHLIQMGLVQSQAQKDFDLAKLQLEAQNDPAKQMDYLNARAGYISDSMKTFDALMKEAAKRAREAEANSKDAEQAVSDFASAQSGYYNSQLEQLALEKEKQRLIEEEQVTAAERRRNDILSTLITAVGESRNVAGLGKVLVIRPDDPSFADYLREVRDGLDPEGQKLFDEILQSKYGKNRGFSV